MMVVSRQYEDCRPGSILGEREELVLRDGSTLRWEWDLDAMSIVVDDEPMPVARLCQGESYLLRTAAGRFRLTSRGRDLDVRRE